MDFGEKGLEETLQELEKIGIYYIGAGRNKEEASNLLF